MTTITLPAKATFTGATVTEGEFKTAFDNLIDFLDNTLGTVSGNSGEGYLNLSSGTTATRPASSESGWLRFNTDTNQYEVTNVTVWDKLIKSTVDATWAVNLSASQTGGLRTISTTANNEFRVESTSGNLTTGIVSGERYIKCSGTSPLRIYINNVAVIKIDSSGNFTTTGTITQKGTV